MKGPGGRGEVEVAVSGVLGMFMCYLVVTFTKFVIDTFREFLSCIVVKLQLLEITPIIPFFLLRGWDDECNFQNIRVWVNYDHAAVKFS